MRGLRRIEDCFSAFFLYFRCGIHSTQPKSYDWGNVTYKVSLGTNHLTMWKSSSSKLRIFLLTLEITREILLSAWS